jgi:hypothetical protein
MTEKQYIRVKADGFIYDYNERMAVHPACEVITEQVAYPERFITPVIAEKIEEITKPKRTKKPHKGLDLTTDIPTEPVYTDPELAAEAIRGWPE